MVARGSWREPSFGSGAGVRLAVPVYMEIVLPSDSPNKFLIGVVASANDLGVGGFSVNEDVVVVDKQRARIDRRRRYNRIVRVLWIILECRGFALEWIFVREGHDESTTVGFPCQRVSLTEINILWKRSLDRYHTYGFVPAVESVLALASRLRVLRGTIAGCEAQRKRQDISNRQGVT